MNTSIQEKEKLIVSTILRTNIEISNCCKLFERTSNKNLFEDFKQKQPIYKYNMLGLYSSIVDENIMNLNESEIISINSFENPRKNYYSYFKKIDEFLCGYELPIQSCLNENLIVDTKKVDNPIQLNIFSFKEDLKNIIQKLSEIDDTQNLSDNILKIKIFAKTPLHVYGYNIINNIDLMLEFSKLYNIQQNQIDRIIFNKYDKSLLFFVDKSYIKYSIENDELSNLFVLPNKLNNLNDIKAYFNVNSLIEIYFNVDILNLKFTDNLYNDVKWGEFINTKQGSSIVKR